MAAISSHWNLWWGGNRASERHKDEQWVVLRDNMQGCVQVQSDVHRAVVLKHHDNQEPHCTHIQRENQRLQRNIMIIMKTANTTTNNTKKQSKLR